ncbi:AAA family ATPase [Cryobacterium sp. Hh38]|uniref:AAA family ATPase n=1 Tax=Cryobacterium sp. Hh38 TaxID=1259156 RepID=UPI00141BC9D5|nr:AAA family ATPase [Cryobacterium sp. Hh38]
MSSTDKSEARAKDWAEILGEPERAPEPEDFAPADQEEEDRLFLEVIQAEKQAEVDRDVQPGNRDSHAQPAATVQPDKPAGPRPVRPQLSRLYVENLKSLAGRHEIPLAPLTLIYGPNSAGKSTVLLALRLFARAAKEGRHDALHLWENCLGEYGGFNELISGHEEYGRLGLGVDFLARQVYARAAISIQPYPIADQIIQKSALSTGPTHLAIKTVAIDYGDLVGGDAIADEPIYSVQDGEGDDPRRVRAENGLFAEGTEGQEDALYETAAHLVYLGPHRGDPKHTYEPGPQPFDLRKRGDFPRDNDLNDALSRLEVPYRFERKSTITGGRSTDTARRLVDTRTGVEVGLNQVGYGVSQLLPVVDACINSAGQVICIEQPELHIHPRLQAKLGNLFVSSIRRGNQIIAETHSENVLLRVRKMIRRGHIKPEEVAVIYVDNTISEGVTIQRLRLGVQGELLDPWPTGFFDESLRDILGIME